MKNPIATLHMSSGHKIKIEIYPNEAPNTAKSFIWLAEQGAFDHRPIKRIVPDFVIQPSFNAFEKDERCDFMIEGEFRANGFNNQLPLTKYAIAMGGDGETLASGSCFFIVVGEAMDRLDGKYAGFAKVVEGFEEVDRLAGVKLKAVATDLPGVVVNEPENPEIIEKITVETFGQTFEAPVKTKGVWAYEKREVLSGTLFQHYKGNQYQVLHVGKHSETGEEMVVYQKLTDPEEIWIRPLDMFVESILVDGKVIKRFRKIS